MEELKPCPFCGTEVEISEGMYGFHTHFQPRCTKCGCSLDIYSTFEEAIESWNKRV